MRPLEPYIIFEIIDVNVYRNQSKSERNFTMFRFADKNKLKIGSNLGIEKCDILADSESISEPHAEFTLADGEFYVKDLKSRYGTFVETDEISPLKGVVRI